MKLLKTLMISLMANSLFAGTISLSTFDKCDKMDGRIGSINDLGPIATVSTGDLPKIINLNDQKDAEDIQKY